MKPHRFAQSQLLDRALSALGFAILFAIFWFAN